MMKLYMLVFVWGPALLGFSLGWLIWHLRDWTGPAVMAPIGLVLTLVTYRWGLRRLKTLQEPERLSFAGGMIAGAGVGLMVFGMLLLRVIP